MRLKAVLAAGTVAGIVCAAAALAYAWHTEIAAIETPDAASFEPALVQRGSQLALIGDCKTCHTAPGGRVFAGGLAMPTPFGTLYSTNITPDRETGIGAWSQAAFERAMRQGVDRQGRHLYPALPYDHFTLVSDADTKALYAYFMTRQPVRATAPANELPFPINIRLVLAGWKLLFFREQRFAPTAGKDEQWNRGRYLVEGLGHCGACHTPRNLMGAEEKSRAFEGGEAEGWHAFALGKASQAPVRWNATSLQRYLADGFDADHGGARGPMEPVVENLSQVPREEVAAIAAYLASLAPADDDTPRPEAAAITAPSVPQSAGLQVATPGQAPDLGARLYANACASCHESGRALPLGGVPLALSTAVAGESPENLLNLILNGIPAFDSTRKPIMPSFGVVMSDEQVVALARHLRTKLAGRPGWPMLEQAVGKARAAQIAARQK